MGPHPKKNEVICHSYEEAWIKIVTINGPNNPYGH
jgi:hypothetical protein